jgi:hypothetical protein
VSNEVADSIPGTSWRLRNGRPVCELLPHGLPLAKLKSLLDRGVGVVAKYLKDRSAAQSKWVAEATLQISNKLSLPEQESRRRSPSVPRGAPQCRHLIRVEAEASSLQSKKIPKPSQMPQAI